MIFDPEYGGDTFSETSDHRRTTRRYILEDGIMDISYDFLFSLMSAKFHIYVILLNYIILIIFYVNLSHSA
jgi:hypothetical protein